MYHKLNLKALLHVEKMSCLVESKKCEYQITKKLIKCFVLRSMQVATPPHPPKPTPALIRSLMEFGMDVACASHQMACLRAPKGPMFG